MLYVFIMVHVNEESGGKYTFKLSHMKVVFFQIMLNICQRIHQTELQVKVSVPC